MSKEEMIEDILSGMGDILRATLQMKIQKATTKGLPIEITGYYMTPDLLRIDIKGVDQE
jgi:hypothetical protein